MVTGALLAAQRFSPGASRRNQSLTEAMTADIEWNGEPLGFTR